jgi:hypothetical protein
LVGSPSASASTSTTTKLLLLRLVGWFFSLLGGGCFVFCSRVRQLVGLVRGCLAGVACSHSLWCFFDRSVFALPCASCVGASLVFFLIVVSACVCLYLRLPLLALVVRLLCLVFLLGSCPLVVFRALCSLLSSFFFSPRCWSPWCCWLLLLLSVASCLFESGCRC